MLKRLCVSLVHASPRCHRLPKCSSLRPDTLRHDTSVHPLQLCSFTTTSRRCAATTSSSRAVSARKSTQPSTKSTQATQTKAAQRSGAGLAQIGLLPNTFIPPTGTNLTSWFQNARERLQIERYRLWNLYYRLYSPIFAWLYIKPRPQLEISKTPKVARELYEKMYKAFAKGSDLQSLGTVLSPGLRASLRARIAQREPGSSLLWRVHRYIERPKCVSYMLVALPGGNSEDRTGIAQSVVRIRSLQSVVNQERALVVDPLTKKPVMRAFAVNDEGNQISAEKIDEEHEKKATATTEYVVLQAVMLKSKLGPWTIWGFTGETSAQQIQENARRVEGMNMS